MHIVVDGRTLAHPLRGIGVYTRELTARLPTLGPRHRWTLLTDRPISSLPHPAWTFQVIPAWSRNWWELITLPRILSALGADVYHATDHFQIPWSRHAHCRFVITVHDLASWLFPEHVSWKFHWLFKTRLARAASIAQKIIAVSAHTRKDLELLVPIARGKTSVIPLGVGPHFRRLDPDHARSTTARLGIPTPYILSVSAIEPRKNFERLIHAYVRLKETTPSLSHHLAIVGQPWLRTQTLYDMTRGRSDIHWLGYVPDDDLIALYVGADLFVYPSLYEGFGLPVLEAMACGTPVITSNTSCFPEVAGDAAVLVDPTNEGTIAHAIQSALQDRSLLTRLAQGGPIHAKQFSWDRTAQETLALYESLG